MNKAVVTNSIKWVSVRATNDIAADAIPVVEEVEEVLAVVAGITTDEEGPNFRGIHAEVNLWHIDSDST